MILIQISQKRIKLNQEPKLQYTTVYTKGTYTRRYDIFEKIQW